MTDHRDDRHSERISVRDANQGFSKLVARVEQGERFVVARIEPVESDEEARLARVEAALARIRETRKKARPPKDGWIYKGKRHELHDRSA